MHMACGGAEMRHSVSHVISELTNFRSGNKLPATGLLIYLALPNSNEYLVGEDTYIWGYVLPDDADIRTATGWVNGAANVFYTATGVPIVALATEIAAAILPANVVFSLIDATTQTGKLAIYTATTTEVTLAKARSVLRDESINYLFYGRTAIAYDPQDLTTLFQDAQGALPGYRPGMGQVDPPVGLMMDKSQGLELGPELWDGVLIVTNGTSGSNGVYDAETGELSNTVVGTLSYIPAFLGGEGLLEMNKFYRVRLKFSGNLTPIFSVTLNRGLASAIFSAGGISGNDIRSAGGEYEYIGIHTVGTSTGLRISTDGTTTWDGLFIESISIREIKGYHAYQSTPTARPTLSGRYNLLLATETLSTQSVTTAATTYTLSFSGTGTITLSGTATGTYSAGTHTITCTIGTLICTVAGAVTRADLRVKLDGSSLPAYQAVVDANNYDTAGFPLFLKRDKVDDVLICVAPAITGSQGMGSTGGAVLGPVIIPAGTYTPLSESATTGIPEITRYVAVDGTLTASEQAVVERYLSAPSSGVFADEPVFSFGLTSVASFSFNLQTKADTVPVLIDWGDGTQSTHAGTTDQTASHTYSASGTYAVKVYGADESVLTKFSTSAAGMSGDLVMPSGMTYFRCTGSNALTGTLSLPAGMTDFECTGSNTLTGTLSLPSGMTLFICGGSSTLSGTLVMPDGMTYFYCAGLNTLTGTLSLPAGMTYFYCRGANTLSGYMPSWKASNQQLFRLDGLNTMSATDVDNILIDYDTAGGTWAAPKEITIQGNAANRTSASDAAYTSLAAKLTTLSVD